MRTLACLSISALILAVACDNDPVRENDLVRKTASAQLEVLSSGTSVSGHGNWINLQGEYVSRTFHGIVKKDGVVEGNFVQHITALNGDKRVNKSTVDCIRLLSTTAAVISGTVEENINPSVIGLTQIFVVQDNGEGAGDPPDQISALVFRLPSLGIDCSNIVSLPTPSDIEAGNIQVKP